jgi:surface polysaccharide O-acyltransferase-like enzyme
LDLARVIAIFGVVAIHIGSPFLVHLDPRHPGAWWVGNVDFALTRWTVPVFVMISGALAIDGQQRSLRGYYGRRLPRIVVPLVAWSLVYWAFRIVHDGEAASAAWFVKSVLTATTYGHLYFLAAILGLAVITPVLAAFWNGATRGEQLVITFVALGLSLAIRGLQEFQMMGSVTLLDWWLPFLGYYLGGAFLRDVELSSRRRLEVAALFALSAALIAANAWLSRTTGSAISVGWTYSYFGPLAMINALAAFALLAGMRRVRIRTFVLRGLAALVLGIYLVNPILVAILNDVIALPTAALPAAAYLVLATISVVAASAILTSLGARIPRLRRALE